MNRSGKSSFAFVPLVALLIFLLFAFFNTTTARAINTGSETPDNETSVHVEYFYDPACPKCAKASPVIDKVVNDFGSRIFFEKHNVKTDSGLEKATGYKLPGIPAVVIANKNIISYSDYEGDTAKLEMLLRKGIDEAISAKPAANSNDSRTNGEKPILSVPSVLFVGFLAGFNPCLLAILAFLASVALASTGKRRNVIYIVIMFSLGIVATYTVIGVGLLKIFEESGYMQGIILNFLVILIGGLGIWHIYDAYHLRKNTESSFYTPKIFIRFTESVTKNVNLPASFFMGALFSLIKAPCVGAVYLVILNMVQNSGERVTGLFYLLVFNLGVVLPLLVLGAAIAFGLNPARVEKFRKDRRSAIRFVTGVTLIVIAALMYVGWI